MFSIIYIDEVDSTNAFAKKNLCKIRNNTFIYTFNQTAGYGQQKSKWISSPYKDLACSFAVKPTINNSEIFLLNQITSIAVLNTLKHFCKEDIKIKWPNDILINNKKNAGILIENQFIGNKLETSIIGIGVNINSTHFGEVRFPATSLFLETQRLIPLYKVAEILIEEFQKHYNNHNNIHNEYLNHLWKYKEHHNFKDRNGPFVGTIIDVTKTGILVIKDLKGNNRKYRFKEIEFLSYEFKDK